MQITVPFGGSNVIPEGEGPSRHPADSPAPLAQRKSLHTVRIAAPTTPEYKPEWTDKMQLKWRPVEPPEEPAAAEEQPVESTVPRGNGLPDAADQPYDALHREIAELKQTMQLMAQSQLGGGQLQQPQEPQPPNPADFDLYDASQQAEYHRQYADYNKAIVRQEVQAALAPHQGAMQNAEYTRQYNSVLADHGYLADNSENPNFKPLMQKALQLVGESNGQISIPDAYDRVELEAYRKSRFTSPHQAAPSQSAKPAQRTLTAQEAAQKAAQAHSLPPRNGVSGAGEPGLPSALQNVNSLGRIIFHNQQTGRARPINW